MDEWEKIANYTSRLKVPSGWIYVVKTVFSPEGQEYTHVFVPDPTNKPKSEEQDGNLDVECDACSEPMNTHGVSFKGKWPFHCPECKHVVWVTAPKTV